MQKLFEKSQAIERLLKEKYNDRKYWQKNHFINGNAEETEIEIEALEYHLKDIKECLAQALQNNE